MRTWLLATALVLAGVGFAGIASANDDCLYGGFYNVCLLDDHTYAFAGPWYTYSSSYNTPATASAYIPGLGGTGNGVYQSSYAYTDCWFSCTSYQSDGTGVYSYRYIGPLYGGASVYQGSSSSSSSWGTYTSHGTGVGVYQSLFFTGVSAGAQQYGYGGPGYSYCFNNVYFYAFFGFSFPLGPCAMGTPLGTVDTTAPQLYDTCVATGTPAGTVCGRLPDYPDGTGLPFL